jgi:GT2 family glycosyltransferase
MDSAPSSPAPTDQQRAAPADTIAVVVLTHNRVHLLRQCVENVLQRTSAATREIVIWDNGSPDGTGAYLESLDDPRIRVVRSKENIGQNAYARAFQLTTSPYLVELDDDVVDAPAEWDAILLDAFRKLPAIGFLAADLEDDPHDLASRYRHHIRPHEYTLVEENGVRLLRGPAGGGCAMTSRELNERVGGFRQDKKQVFWLEDEAYIGDIARLGFGAAVLADLTVHHTGGPHYTVASKAKIDYWTRYNARRARRTAVKRALYRIPLFPRLNKRFRWFVPALPSKQTRDGSVRPGEPRP